MRRKTPQEWTEQIIWSVARAARGRPEPLRDIAQLLADQDTAAEALAAAGYGDAPDDTLLMLVAEVLEQVGQLRDELAASVTRPESPL